MLNLPAANQWYVITGGPSSGKTTTINSLAKRGYKTTVEHARYYLEMQRDLGRSVEDVRMDLRELQLAILRLQIAEEKKLNPEEQVFLDRAIPDTHAYYHFLHLPESEELTQALLTVSYKKIFILDCLPLVHDYARIEDEAAQKQIQKAIIEVYSSLPFPLVHVPVMDTSKRVDFILQNL